MLLLVLQISAMATVAIFLVCWRAGLRRCNARSWKSLIAQLRPDWSVRELSDQFLWKEGLNATPEVTLTRMQGPHGLWAIYQNAKVMLEMADDATHNSDSVDRVLVETLRSDALQIRVCVITAFVHYAFGCASESVRVNAFRAASMYTGMAARMTQLLQENAAIMVPDFVAAM